MRDIGIPSELTGPVFNAAIDVCFQRALDANFSDEAIEKLRIELHAIQLVAVCAQDGTNGCHSTIAVGNSISQLEHYLLDKPSEVRAKYAEAFRKQPRIAY